MKEMFPEYHYFPDFQQLWKSATFVFDTNVLLDVYRLSPETSSDLIKILMHLKRKNRMWIPYQFAREYYRNLPRIRREVGANYDRRMKELDKLTQVILNLLRVFDAQTDFELDEQIGNLEYTFRTIRTGLKAHRRKHRDRLESDDLERTVEKLFKGRIGSPCSDKRLAEIFEEGARRYALGRPPGFKDKHGDLIGWLQIVEFACEGKPKRPVILITRDSGGEDWFYRPRIDDKVYGPHPELVKEMRDQAGVELFIYQTGEFMALANENLSLDEPVPASSIEEAKILNPSRDLLGNVAIASQFSSDYLKQLSATMSSEIASDALKTLTASNFSTLGSDIVRQLTAPHYSEYASEALKQLTIPISSIVSPELLSQITAPLSETLVSDALKHLSTSYSSGVSLAEMAQNAKEAASALDASKSGQDEIHEEVNGDDVEDLNLNST